MRFRGIIGAALVTALLSTYGTAHAAPVTFEFTTPSWDVNTNAAEWGTHSLLRLTVDNGSDSTVNQHYLNSQITEASVSAVGGTFSHTWGANHGAGFADLSYLSTDAGGVPTLNLLASDSQSFYLFIDEGSLVFNLQLGVITGAGGWITFAAWTFDPADSSFSQAASFPLGSDGLYSGFALSGRVVPNASVPEPLSLSLVCLGLAGLVVSSRKRHSRQV